MRGDPAMIDVTVLLLEGNLPSTSVAPLEIFASAGALWATLRGAPAEPRFRVSTASYDGSKTRCFVPLTMEPSGALTDVRATDLVVIPASGRDIDESLRRNTGVIEWLRHRRPKKTAVAGICSGVCLLAEAGLLDGKPATTHWGIVDELRRRYPRVKWAPERFVTESGGIFCGGGLYASIDLSLYLVEHYCGHVVAVQTARAMLLDGPRRWQSPYADQARPTHDDEPIQRAQEWMVSHLREAADLDALAARVGMSPRNFSRRFKTATGDAPLAHLHRMRIDRARRSLERARRSIAEISRDVGYEDVAYFRALFRRHTGTSPREYRARFGPRETGAARR